jgi:hypothetical protein
MDPHTMKATIILFWLMLSTSLNAQFTNWNWALGDSCGMRFTSTGIDSNYITAVNARGTCASISDVNGELLFYAASPDYNIWNSFIYERGAIYNKNHLVMQNGLYIKTSAWYNEMVILPDPGNVNEFYLFTAGITSTTNPGLRYSKIDLSQNGGLGAVTQKNVMLDPMQINDGIIAVKHGNGRDWWLIYKHGDPPNDSICRVLVTPSGISMQSVQKIGTNMESGFYRLSINPEGNLIAGVSIRSVIELFDFDRCTGLLSNHRYIRNNIGSQDDKEYYWSVEFSGSGRYLYVATADWTSYLYQFDLQNTNPWSSRVLLDSIDIPLAPASTIRRGPDNRIYRAIAWNNGLSYNYPYPDSAWNVYNTHLSVINHPDSSGLACDYQPFSVYLPGCRTYLGLPNNPDYTLGALTGSPCDTLAIGIEELKEEIVRIVPNPSTTEIKIESSTKTIRPGTPYRILDITGRTKLTGHLQSETSTINVQPLAPGAFLLEIFTQYGYSKARFVKMME